MNVTYPNVDVELLGTDGSAFAVITKVTAALRKEISPEVSKVFANSAIDCESYDELLQFVMRTVNVK